MHDAFIRSLNENDSIDYIETPISVTVKTVHACPNFEVSCPTFKCRMWRFGNRLQRFTQNVPTFRQNVRANLSNFIQDLFWRVRFSNENFKMGEREVSKRRFQDGRGRPC